MKKPLLLRQIHISVFAIIFGGMFLLTCPMRSDDVDLKKFENRKPYSLSADFGKLTTYRTAPMEMERFVRDRIPFRGALITCRNVIIRKLWGISGSIAVIIGKDKTLFNRYRDNLYPDDVAGVSLRPFTDEQVKEQAKYFEEVNEWLSYRGIRYALVLVPTKQTIYPELLPDGSNQVIHCTRADQMVSYLKNHSNVPVIDVRDEVKKHRKETQLYLKNDTHWNSIGAFHAYNYLVSQLSTVLPSIKPINTPHYLEPSIKKEPDLGCLTRLPEFLAEPTIEVRRNKFRYRRLKQGDDDVTTTDEKSAPRALVYHDSMFYGMMPFFADHFSYAKYLTSYMLDPRDIPKYSPDLVVQQMSEGTISNEGFSSPVGTLLADERFKNGQTLLSFDDRDDLAAVDHKRLYGLENCWQTKAGEPLNCLTNDPQIHFVSADTQGDRTLKAQVEVSQPTRIQLFYKVQGEPFTEQRSVQKQLKKGKNEIIFKMPKGFSNFRLDPCAIEGPARVAFEVSDLDRTSVSVATRALPSAKSKTESSNASLY